MAFAQLIAPTTAGVGTAVDTDATFYHQVIIAADTLAGAEVAGIFVKVNGKYVSLGNTAGTAIGLTATVSAVLLPGGVTYGVTKGATVGACGVYITGVNAGTV